MCFCIFLLGKRYLQNGFGQSDWMMLSQKELRSEEWQKQLSQLPAASRDIYFTPEYHALHVANGDGEASCATVSNGSQTLIVPGLRTPIPPTNAFDLQTCNGYGGPLASPGVSRDFLEHAWTHWRKRSADRGLVAAFFRLHPLVNNDRWLPSDAQVIHDRHTVFIDLADGPDAVWPKANSKHRNMVSKGRRDGCEVRWDEEKGWEQFEDLYAAAMTRMDAPNSLHFSRAYFRQLRSLSGVELAWIGTSEILKAAAVFLNGPMWCHYHLAVRLQGTENHLMNCILQSALERAARRGLKGMHLGGGRTTSHDDSLLRFKRALGGRILDFKVALVVADRELYRCYCDQWVRKVGSKPNWLLGYRQPQASSQAEGTSS
jgi:hypothetical protein